MFSPDYWQCQHAICQDLATIFGLYLLLSFAQVQMDDFVVSEATLSQSQTDTIRIGRAASAVDGESWRHGGRFRCRCVQEFRYEPGAVVEELRHELLVLQYSACISKVSNSLGSDATWSGGREELHGFLNASRTTRPTVGQIRTILFGGGCELRRCMEPYCRSVDINKAHLHCSL